MQRGEALSYCHAFHFSILHSVVLCIRGSYSSRHHPICNNITLATLEGEVPKITNQGIAFSQFGRYGRELDPWKLYSVERGPTEYRASNLTKFLPVFFGSKISIPPPPPSVFRRNTRRQEKRGDGKRTARRGDASTLGACNTC